MKQERLSFFVRCLLLSFTATLAACSAEQSTDAHEGARTSLAVRSRGADSIGFHYDGDIALTMSVGSISGVREGQIGAPRAGANIASAEDSGRVGMAYHLRFTDSAGIVVAGLTRPEGVAERPTENSALSAPNWRVVRRIVLSSESAHPQLTLSDGRVIAVDHSKSPIPVNGFRGQSGPDLSHLEAVTPTRELRAMQLRTMMASLVRIPGQERASAFASAADQSETEWAPVSPEVEAVVRRRVAAKNSVYGAREVLLSVSNVRLSGVPNLP